MRASESVAFLHDADASQDEKMMEVIAIHGNRGYGAFWRLVERMRVATSYRLDTRLIAGIAKSIDESPADAGQLLETFEAVGLFEREDEHFVFSPSLRRRMEAYSKRRDALSEAGRKGGLSKPKARLKPGLSKACEENKPSEACLNTNTNTTLIEDLSTSLVGTDLGTNPVPDPSKPTPRKVRTQPTELPPLPDHLDTATVRSALNDWLDYKRERGEAYKPAGLKQLIAKLADWDELRIVRAVRHSASSNYAGLFEPKPGDGGRPAKQTNFEKLAEFHRREAMEAENG